MDRVLLMLRELFPAIVLQSAMAFRAVHKDRNGKENVTNWHLAAGENGARRDAELVIASLALP